MSETQQVASTCSDKPTFTNGIAVALDVQDMVLAIAYLRLVVVTSVGRGASNIRDARRTEAPVALVVARG